MCYVLYILQCLTNNKDEEIRVIILCSIFILPLCFVKDWESLSILSKIKTFVYAMVVLFVVTAPPWTRGEAHPRDLNEFLYDRKTWVSSNFFRTLGTFAFATVYHDCIFPVKQSMKDQTINGWSKVSKFALFLVTVISAVLGVFGFVHFRIDGNEYPPNLFIHDGRLFDSNNELFKIARYVLVGLMLMTVPLCVHVARDYIEAIKEKITQKDNITEIKNENIIKQTIEGGNVQNGNTENDVDVIVNSNLKTTECCNKTNNKEVCNNDNTKDGNCISRFLKLFEMTMLEYVITISVYLVIILLSIKANGNKAIEHVIDMVGDYACAGIAFVLPPVIFFCTFKRKEYSVFKLMASLMVLAFGLFCWFYETTKTFFGWEWKFE